MNPDNQQCEDFEPLVSALIDGELSSEEVVLVESHLEQCCLCRQLKTDFERIDAAVEVPFIESATVDKPFTETIVLTRQKPSLKSWLSVWRLVPVAAVAVLLLGLFIVTTQSPPAATAEQLTPEQFVKPMTDLDRINRQQQRDQELMLRTLGMDLRALKLELKQLENADAEDRQRFEKKINQMLARVRQFESDE